MAATLQDVSTKLMKPAKDLAEWNFPLSQILENYNLLLKEPCDLNFGEAGLVIQNSANVYGRRVEYLFQDTSALNQSMNDYQQEENNETETNQRKHTTKSKINFDNFELINFTKDINKNSNLKPTKEEKKIKLLSQRYPQLENLVRNKFSLEIVDVNGEIMGKKYDFRCNQQLSISKMLIDEVTPDDFIPKQINSNVPEILETDLEVVNAFESCSEYGDTFRDAGVFSPFQESAYGSMISNSDANTPRSRDLSDFSLTLNDNMRDPKDLLMSPIDPVIECDKNLISESEQLQISENESKNLQSIDNLVDGDTIESNPSIDRTSRIRDSIETDAGYTSGDPDDIQQQTPVIPKKIRRFTRSSVVNELNEKTWEPIPFNESVPDKLPKSRSEFKLPCHISLLKYHSRPRKKYSDSSLKRKNLKRYLLKENNETNDDDGECDRKKLLLFSPTKSMLHHSKEEIEELQKIIEQRFKSKSQFNSCNYRAVENSHKDLLGFEVQLKEYNNVMKNCESTIQSPQKFVEDSKVIENNCESQLGLSLPPEASCSYTPPQSPEYVTNFDAHEIPDSFDESPNVESTEENHQQRIENKMKQLQNEFDIRNEQQEETRRWYKTIEALESVQYRTTFDVHKYEQRILDALKTEKSHQLQFDTIIAQQQPDDFARLFVASLHLAGAYNIHINVVQSNEISHMNLKLLNGDLNTIREDLDIFNLTS